MMDAMISVIIPTYRRSETLSRAIKSVLDQTYRNTEVLVVDDNEPDDEFSLTVQETLKAIRDPRVRYIRQEKHMNGSAARNAGIDTAVGDYIAFLDDDDIWYPDKLQKQMDVFREDPEIGLVYTGARAVYGKDGVSYAVVPKRKGDLRRTILLGNCIGTTSTVVVKKDVIVRAGKFDPQMPALQDYDLWIRICRLTETGFVPEAEIDYYNYGGGTQISSDTAKYEAAFALLNGKYREEISSLDRTEKKKKRNYELTLLANKALRNHEKRKGRSYLKETLRSGFDGKAFVMLLLSPFPYRLTLCLRKAARPRKSGGK